MKLNDPELVKILEILKREISPEKIILFGSRAVNKDNKRSDYDILCIVKESRNTRSLEKKLYVTFALEGIGRAVDLIVETEDDFSKHKDNTYMVYSEVSRHGKTVYERKTAA
jgi:predicted nucleotidyltransferase